MNIEPIPFEGFPKIPRLSRDCIITEKLDGTNASILITDDGQFLTGSRTRWITPADDNYGFSRWAWDNKDELMRLGPGHHFGEWWGRGIQRTYGLGARRFSLFNTSRWDDPGVRPQCCEVVPTLYRGPFETEEVHKALHFLRAKGSVAAPGFVWPEGVVVFHTAANKCFKKTLEQDGAPKGVS